MSSSSLKFTLSGLIQIQHPNQKSFFIKACYQLLVITDRMLLAEAAKGIYAIQLSFLVVITHAKHAMDCRRHRKTAGCHFGYTITLMSDCRWGGISGAAGHTRDFLSQDVSFPVTTYLRQEMFLRVDLYLIQWSCKNCSISPNANRLFKDLTNAISGRSVGRSVV